MAQCHFFKILIYAICLRYDIAKLLLKLAWSTSQSVKHSLYFMPLITNWYIMHVLSVLTIDAMQGAW